MSVLLHWVEGIESLLEFACFLFNIYGLRVGQRICTWHVQKQAYDPGSGVD